MMLFAGPASRRLEVRLLPCAQPEVFRFLARSLGRKRVALKGERQQQCELLRRGDVHAMFPTLNSLLTNR